MTSNEESGLPVVTIEDPARRAGKILKTIEHPTRYRSAKWLGKWSGRPGSNRRHSAWEADGLPLTYSRPLESNAYTIIDRAVESVFSGLNSRTGSFYTLKHSPNRQIMREYKGMFTGRCSSVRSVLDRISAVVESLFAVIDRSIQ